MYLVVGVPLFILVGTLLFDQQVILRDYSSIGQSRGLIIRWFSVRVRVVPLDFVRNPNVFVKKCTLKGGKHFLCMFRGRFDQKKGKSADFCTKKGYRGHLLSKTTDLCSKKGLFWVYCADICTFLGIRVVKTTKPKLFSYSSLRLLYSILIMPL